MAFVPGPFPLVEKKYEPRRGDVVIRHERKENEQKPVDKFEAMLVREVKPYSIEGRLLHGHNEIWDRREYRGQFVAFYLARFCRKCSSRGENMDDCGCFSRCDVCRGVGAVVVGATEEHPLWGSSDPEHLRSIPDDIRNRGWMVAVHNDYMQSGVHMTFWLFTRKNECVKGEGSSDALALDQIRTELLRREKSPGSQGVMIPGENF